MARHELPAEHLTAGVDNRDLATQPVATKRFPARDAESRPDAGKESGRRIAAFAAGCILVVGAVAALHNLYRSGDSTTDLIGWAGLLLLSMTALGGGIKLALWGAKPVTDAGFAAVKARVPESVQAVAASGAVIAGALGMWWVFRGGYAAWWQHFSGEAGWSLALGVGQMLVAVLAGAALFTGGKYLTGLTKEVLTDAGVLLERDRTSGSSGASEGVWHPGLVAALIGGGLGLVLLTAGITPRLYVWITGPDVFPAVGAITFVLLWAIGSNLGWWKGLGGLYKWATDASQKAGATAGVVAVLMFSAGGLGLGWFTPATVPVARAACPPDCGGPGGSDGPPGGGQMFQPPSQGGPQMPDYQGGVNQPPMDQNGSVSIYNTQAPSISNNGVNGSNGQQGWDQPAHGTQPPNYQNATPYTQGPGKPNPEYNPGSQGGQTNQGVQQPQQAPQNQQLPQNNTGQNPSQQPNQSSDQQKIDDLTRQLQDQQQQSGQDRQRLDDLTKQLQQQNKQNKKQDLPKFPSKDDKKDRDQQEQQDRDKQSGNNDLAALLMGAASTRRRKQDEQEQGPDAQALGQDASQAAQGLPGDVQTYVQSGQQIGQASGQAAQGFGSAAQAGASLASSAQSGAVNPQDAITLVQGVSQGVQGTADAVNAGSQIVKTAQKEADQAAQAVGDANPQLKPQMQQLTQLNDQASQVTDLVGQGAQITSQGAGAVSTVSSLGAGGVPDGGGTAEAMSGPASQTTDAATDVQSVELMSGPVPQDVPEPAPEPLPNPEIIGITRPELEQTKADLLTSVPGKNLTFTGDPRGGHPMLNGQSNPLFDPNSGKRPLPTGTGLGVNNRPYGMFSFPEYAATDEPAEQANPWNFVSPNTSVFDFSNPNSPVHIGDLKGISQGSAAYDQASKTMLVVGNDGWGGNAPRALWQSAAIDPASPNSWVSSLTKVGNISGGGIRENQIAALPSGGFLLLDGNTTYGIGAKTASTPGGLLDAAMKPLIAGGEGNSEALATVESVYGPNVINLTPVEGGSSVLARVSAWPPGPDPYNPQTWTFNINIAQP
ncbi:hypothetical protein DE4585_03309 [Mycobacteroides salmoniphilum]|uniref:Uncharacterized protein n=1 Tax=Mycobacteroides salmoniphilum TaxID=404941 RepID=A0A4R8S1D9_9MYCO|nr:hypothetical protein DE4585_03309 [Mycobacteroides salmoniphilum]